MCLSLSLSAWLPAPALFGMAIDSSCIWWKRVCGKKFSCGYYDNNILRNRLENLNHVTHRNTVSTPTSLLTTICRTPCRYLGLQVGYKAMGVLLLVLLGWKVQRTQEYSLEKSHESLLWPCRSKTSVSERSAVALNISKNSVLHEAV